MIEREGMIRARDREVEIERERQKITPRNWVVDWSVLQHTCRNQPVFGWNSFHLPCATISLSLLFPLLLLCIPAPTPQPIPDQAYAPSSCHSIYQSALLPLFSPLPSILPYTLHSLSSLTYAFHPLKFLFGSFHVCLCSIYLFFFSLSLSWFCYLWLSTLISLSLFPRLSLFDILLFSLFLSLSLDFAISSYRRRSAGSIPVCSIPLYRIYSGH